MKSSWLLACAGLWLACGGSTEDSLGQTSGLGGRAGGAGNGEGGGLAGTSLQGGMAGMASAGGGMGPGAGSGGTGQAGSSIMVGGAGGEGGQSGGADAGGQGGASGMGGALAGAGGIGTGASGSGGHAGSLVPNDWPVASCTFDTAQEIPYEQAPYVHIVLGGSYFVPACIRSPALATTVTFTGLTPKYRLRAMKNSGAQPNPIAVGEPHQADFTLEMLEGGPYGFYIEGLGSDGPPGETGMYSGAIYLSSPLP